MNRTEADALVREAVAKLLPLNARELRPDDGLDRTPGWDSLTHVDILRTLESGVGVSIDFMDDDLPVSVNDLVNFLVALDAD